MIPVTDSMVNNLRLAILGWLAGWKTPDDFADYAEEDRCTVALEIIADCHRGIYIPRHVAEVLDIPLTAEDLQYDDGNEAIEEGTEKLAAQIQAELDKLETPGYVFFGYMEHSGDYALQWSIDIDDLPYPQ